MLPTLVRAPRAVAAWVVARLDLRGERAATAVEYGLIVMLIAAAIVTVVYWFGIRTGGMFDCAAESVRTNVTRC